MQRQFNHVFTAKILREFADRLKFFKAIYRLIKIESNVQTIHRQIELRFDRKFSDRLKFFKAIYRLIKIESNVQTIHRQIELRFDRKFSDSPFNFNFKFNF